MNRGAADPGCLETQERVAVGQEEKEWDGAGLESTGEEAGCHVILLVHLQARSWSGSNW